MEARIDILSISLILLLNGLIYSNSFDLEYAFGEAIPRVGKKSTHKNLLRQSIEHDYWSQVIERNDSLEAFHPLTNLTFHLNRRFVLNDTDAKLHVCPPQLATSFHLFNLGCNVLSAVAVYFFIVRIGKQGICETETNEILWSKILALLTALYFSCLPSHVDAVKGIAGRADILCGFFAIAGTMLYAKACEYDFSWEEALELDAPKSPNEPSFHFPFHSWLYLIAAIFCAFLAFMSKELGFMTIVVFVLYDILLGSDRNYSGLIRYINGRNSAMIKRLVLVVISGVCFILFRLSFTVSSPKIRHVENPVMFETGINWFLSCLLIHVKYFQLLVLPTSLSADYSFNQIPMVRSIFEFRNLFGLGLLLIVISLICNLLSKSGELFARKLLFLLGWTLAFFFPSSHLLLGVGTTVAERLLYVPSICSSAFFMYIALSMLHSFWKCGELIPGEIIKHQIELTKTDELNEADELEIIDCEEIIERIGRDIIQNQFSESDCDVMNLSEEGVQKKESTSATSNSYSSSLFVFAILIGIYFAYLSKMTYDYNSKWKGGNIFYHSTKVSPNSTKVHYLAALALLQQNKTEEAIIHFNRALEIDPEFCDVEYYLGVCELARGNTTYGNSLLESALACLPVRAKALEAFGSRFRDQLMQKKLNSAGGIKIHIHWAELLEKANSTKDAAYNYCDIISNLLAKNESDMKQRKKNHAAALKFADKAAKLKPKNCLVLSTTAQLLLNYDYYYESLKHFEMLADSYACPAEYQEAVNILYLIYLHESEKNPENEELHRKADFNRIRAQISQLAVRESNVSDSLFSYSMS